MPFRKDETAEHAKRQQHFKDVEKSLRDATELLVRTRREVERSKRIMKDTDASKEDYGAISQQPTTPAVD